MSVASGQRGTNGQPVAAGWRGAGGADAERLAGGAPRGLLGRPRHRRRGGQRDRVRVPGLGVDRLDRAGLHDLAAVEHDRPLGEEPHDAEVVGDEHERQPALVAQVGQQVEHLGLGGEVQGRHRLVEDDDLRVADQRAGDRDALALAAGELRRVAVDGVAGQADRLQAGAGLGQRLGALDAHQPQRLDQGLADRPRRVERGVRVLEDHAQVGRPGGCAA